MHFVGGHPPHTGLYDARLKLPARGSDGLLLLVIGSANTRSGHCCQSLVTSSDIYWTHVHLNGRLSPTPYNSVIDLGVSI